MFQTGKNAIQSSTQPKPGVSATHTKSSSHPVRLTTYLFCVCVCGYHDISAIQKENPFPSPLRSNLGSSSRAHLKGSRLPTQFPLARIPVIVITIITLPFTTLLLTASTTTTTAAARRAQTIAQITIPLLLQRHRRNRTRAANGSQNRRHGPVGPEQVGGELGFGQVQAAAAAEGGRGCGGGGAVGEDGVAGHGGLGDHVALVLLQAAFGVGDGAGLVGVVMAVVGAVELVGVG